MITIQKKLDDAIIPENIRASGLIPVLSYSPEDSLFLMDDQSLGFAFLCEPLTGADEKLQERMNGFLNQDFPTQTVLQFCLFRSPDISHEMAHIKNIRQGFYDPLLSNVIDERIKFLQHYTLENLVTKSKKGIYDNGVVQDLKLVVSCKIPILGNVPTEEEVSEVIQVRTKVLSSLETCSMMPMTMEAPSYIRFMNTVFNWSPEASWRNNADHWEPDKVIAAQIVDPDVDIQVNSDGSGFQLGQQHVRVISAKKTTDGAFFGDAVKYVGDLSGGTSSVKENYMVVCNVYFPDAEKERESIERKRQLTVNQAYGPMLKFVPVLADKKRDFDLMYDSMKEGAKAVKVSYTAVVFAPTKKRAEASVMSLRNIWRESRFEMMEDKFIALPLFLNHLPLCADHRAVRDTFRYKTLSTEQAAVIIPVFGEWKGTGTYHNSLISRNGQVMSLSLHDSETNKNFVIAAESGSGKSFLTNDIIINYLSEGAQVWAIDAGKSYKKLCETLEGDFIQFDESSDICLNPFELIKNFEDEEDTIVNLVSAMASPDGLLSEFQKSGLKQTIGRIWRSMGNTMKIDDVAEACLSRDNDERIRDIGAQLYPFTKEGGYGKYFAFKNNVKFQNRFTVLELDELQGRKHLRQVVLLQLIFQIQQEVFLGDVGRKKIVIIDEAWDLLKEGEVSRFMEHAYRKFRKYDGSMGIATQSINDLYENPVGRAIAENSASMFLLGQTEETVESIRHAKRLTMPDGLFRLLKSVHTVKGVYSEIFIKTKQGIGVGRLIVGEFQKLLYSTDPGDKKAIQQYTDQGLGVAESINNVLRDRGLISGGSTQ